MNNIPIKQHAPQIVLVTDSKMLAPTLFALWGLLRHTTGNGTIYFWGNNLTEKEWKDVRLVAAINSNILVSCRSITSKELQGAKGPTNHISATTMGRLHIAEHLTGRVLYIDGDTHIVGDVTPLFSLNLNGHPIAAVRDYQTAKWSAKNVTESPNRAKRIKEIQELIHDTDISNYFNAGVLLIDTDAIRSERDTFNAMQDITLASSYPMGDQDHLNKLFKNRVLLINPAYNSTWDRAKKQRQYTKQLKGSNEELHCQRNVIIHFHGPDKPWHTPRYDLWKRRARAVWKYRKELTVFKKAFPNISF